MVQEITVRELRDLIQGDEPGVFVVDVRTTGEFDPEHIPGSINVPLDEVSTKLDMFKDKDAIVLICRSGGRSMVACQKLVLRGIDNCINVKGGVQEWLESGFPLASV